MKPDVFSANWVDLIILVLLVVGLIRGRKRGISEELLDILKWSLIVVLASFAYEPMGRYLAQSTFFSLLSCYIFMYALVALVIMLFFTYVRRRVGEKLVSSDVFGNSEYYLGMLAGVYRYACVILVALAFLNARYYTATEIQADATFQQDNFGTISFPTLGRLQHVVFEGSLAGRLTQYYLYPVLIRPTTPQDTALGNQGVFRRRAADVNEILDKR